MLDFLTTSGLEFWRVLCDMAPWLLFGFGVAGLLSVVISPQLIERHLGGRGAGPVAKASIFGVPLPLCSCGVIPVAASLRRHGASRGATTSFIISTPQTGIDSIFVTFSLLGPVFAIFRPLAALLTGIIGGGLVAATEAAAGEPGQAAAEPGQEARCSDEHEGGWLKRSLAYGYVTLPRDIGRALIIGLFVAGVLSAVVPDDYFAGLLGAGIGSMLVMMVVGLPVYVCATASVPVAAALMAKGLSPGAALVFLVTGPATNAAAVATMWKLLGRRAILIYLATVAVGALACGVLLNAIWAAAPFADAQHVHKMLPPWLNTASALALLGVLAAGMLPRRGHGDHSHAGETVMLDVSGMTCSHCEETVRKALAACANVESVRVDRRHGSAEVAGSGLDAVALCQSVTDAGFEATVRA